MTATKQTNLLARAIAIAAVAHENQVDKAGSPYIMHPIRMMMKAQTDDERIVAMLHDVVEDSDWTLSALGEQGFPKRILDALDGVTGRDGETYDEFIERAALNPISKRVKLLDLEDNMIMTRLGSVTDRDLARLRKYHASYVKLSR